MLFILNYKEKVMKTGFIEAGSLESADKLGREYCGEDQGRMFISVKNAILKKEAPVQNQPALQQVKR